MESEYNFTSDWFSHNIHTWSQILTHFKDLPVTFLEIGSYEGRSATWLLDNILTHPDSRLYCCDPFSGSSEHSGSNTIDTIYDRFSKNIEKHKDKVIICKGYSYNVLKSPELINLNFDFIYIDGDHYPNTVLEDAVLAFRLLKYGGIIIFDDYEWNNGFSKDHSPKKGIDAFVDGYENLIEVIHKGYQVSIRKRVPEQLEPSDYISYVYDQVNMSERNSDKYIEWKTELTLAFYKLGQLPRAIDNCDQILLIDPNNIKAYKNKAVCLYLQGLHEAALEVLQKTIELNIVNDDIQNLINELNNIITNNKKNNITEL